MVDTSLKALPERKFRFEIIFPLKPTAITIRQMNAANFSANRFIFMDLCVFSEIQFLSLYQQKYIYFTNKSKIFKL